MTEPLNDYTGRCGACKYFSYRVKKDKLLRWGCCELTEKYKQACTFACSKYKEWENDDDSR